MGNSMMWWDEAWDLEKQTREKVDPKKVCTFGIAPLDDALIGLLRTDLCVIGADSGCGKSEMVLQIAIHNAMAGKSVALYFIEGGMEEAMARIKWKLIRDLYYSKYACGLDMDYRKWRMNMMNNMDLIRKIEKEARDKFVDMVGGRLHIYHFDSSFSMKDLDQSLSWFKPSQDYKDVDPEIFHPDLLIVDHLQYFTLDNPKDELTEMTEILKKVKDITVFQKIPVVLVSHLRKKAHDRGLPSQEDFYGTSNIAKIASVCITITPAPNDDDHDSMLYPTYFRIVKSRTGIRPSLASMCNFNAKRGEYEKTYKVVKLVMDKPTEELIGEARPVWAKAKAAPVAKHNDETILPEDIDFEDD